MFNRRIACGVLALVAAGAGAAMAQPANNACASATLTQLGVPIAGTAVGATADGTSRCSLSSTPDVYHRFTTTTAGPYVLSLCNGTSWDTVLSVHRGCPATGSDTDPLSDNQVGCDDDGCGGGFGVASSLRVFLGASTQYIVRIGAYDVGTPVGAYSLLITPPAEPTGACCVLSTCSLQTAAACVQAGGTFAGVFTSCQAPTGTAQSLAAANLPTPIVNASTIARTITVPAAFPVGAVRVSVGLSHPYSTDLTLRLSKGSTSVTLARRVGLGTLYEGFDVEGIYVFSDAGATTLWQTAQDLPLTDAVLPPGTYQASDENDTAVSLSQAFAGVSSQGDWTLTVIDGDPDAGGTLTSFSLFLEPSSGERCVPTTGACCTGTAQGGLGTTCAVVSQSQCADSGGSFRGPGTVCGPAGNPVACCKANFDAAGGVTIDDIFIYLNAWFATCNGTQAGPPCQGRNADFDVSGSVTIDDIFIYLNAWFAGCPG